MTNAATSVRMSLQRRQDTKPEMAIRRVLHRRGLRYRVNTPLAGLSRRRADITFPTERVVVFVDGCFWHCCPLHQTWPKTNSAWWVAKLRRNVARDRETDERLDAEGWVVIRVWEHEDPESAADRVESAVRERRNPPTDRPMRQRR